MWLILDGAASDFAGVGRTPVHSIPPKPQKTCDSGLLLNSLHVNGWGGISEKRALYRNPPSPTFNLLSPSIWVSLSVTK